MSIARPVILHSVETPKSWGMEHWLNLTQPDPSLLGDWSRLLFGEQLPTFTKLIVADFPPRVHVGFRRAVDKQTLLSWLVREQKLLAELYRVLTVSSQAEFEEFAQVYRRWSISQAEVAWRRGDDADFAATIAGFVSAGARLRLALWAGRLRRNRMALVDELNDVDLRRETGNVLLTPAGVVHAIFGLSLQTHPLDGSGETLRRLFADLRRLEQTGAPDRWLRALVDSADLPALRAANRAAPKNEAWMPIQGHGGLSLVEQQQTSDTTYALADFYTPFVWSSGRVQFRKGDARSGLSAEELEKRLGEIDLSATPLDRIRRVPVEVERQQNATLFRLVDEPASWPYFTAYRLELDGHHGAPASFVGDHAPDVFQQLVVLEGSVVIADAHGDRAIIDPSAPAFIPATLTGGYRLTTSGTARVLVFSVPGCRSF